MESIIIEVTGLWNGKFSSIKTTTVLLMWCDKTNKTIVLSEVAAVLQKWNQIKLKGCHWCVLTSWT